LNIFLSNEFFRNSDRCSASRSQKKAGVAINEKGQVVLTRYPTQYASDRPLVKSDYCSTSLKQQKLLATSIKSDRTEEKLDDATVEELMDFLYSQK
jgi:hypothetical protein